MFVEPVHDLDQWVTFLEELKKDEKIRECLLMILMYNTNLRVSDARLLRWRDVLDEHREVVWRFRVSEKKTSKKRWIPTTDQLKTALGNYYYKYKPPVWEYIFRSRSNRIRGRNQPWTPTYVWIFMNEYCKRTGIRENIGAHTPRKTWGYHAYWNGTDIYRIMRILNHTDVRTTEIYCGLDEEREREVYYKVGKLAAGADNIMRIEDLPEMKRRKRKSGKA